MTTWLLIRGATDKSAGSHRVSDAEFLLGGHNVFGHAWYHGKIDGVFGPACAAAAREAKHDLGYADQYVLPTYGTQLRSFLLGATPLPNDYKQRRHARAHKFVWPTVPHGQLIGFPGQGTHSYTSPPNNWESDNAWDIAVPRGSTVVAVADGTIGPEFGPLPDPDPRFHGQRCHLVTVDNELYYAHLTSFAPGLGPGVHVTQGQHLGLSGEANGVQHLHFALEHLVQISTFGIEPLMPFKA